MRLAFAPFALLIATFAGAADPPADPCAAWNLLGYRLGMTREDAVAQRDGELSRQKVVRIAERVNDFETPTVCIY